MQIVIDIPEKIYKYVQQIGSINMLDTQQVANAIFDGKPLPKGHGRLIDADAYIDKHEECGWLDDITVDEFNAITPTIIEADKEQEE